MGRKSSLTDVQWAEIGRILLTSKESTRSIASRYGTSEASVRRKFPARRNEVRDVANQIVAAESALKELPIASQIDALTLVDELKAMSLHAASAGKYGLMTAHRLNAIAHKQTDKIDETATLEANTETLKSVLAFTKVANEASQIGINLLAANKDRLKDDNDKEVTVHVKNSRSSNV